MENKIIIYDMPIVVSDDQRHYSVVKTAPKELSTTLLYEGEEPLKRSVDDELLSVYHESVSEFVIGDKTFFIRVPDFLFSAIKKKHGSYGKYGRVGFWSRLKYLFTNKL